MSTGKVKALARRHVMEIVLLALCAILAVEADNFFTKANLLNILRNVSMQGLIAFGMTMVIVSGEIDLSVGSAVAFSGCLTAYLTQSLVGLHVPMVVAIPLAIALSAALGFAIGCLTGLIRMRFQVPTFITTLALMTALRGAAQLITNGFPLTPFPDWYNFLGGGHVFGHIPFPALVFVFAFCAMVFLMNYTAFGRAVYAVGGNAEAARLSGIRVTKVKVLVMGTVALLASISGVLQSSEIMSGTATTATMWELEIIAAVIIGGTSLMGGVGTIQGTLVGVLFLGVLVNGMTLMDISIHWQYVVRGALILAAVLVNRAQSPGK